MKQLSIIYLIASIIIIALAIIEMMHIYKTTSIMLLTIVAVSFYQSYYINKQNKEIKELKIKK